MATVGQSERIYLDHIGGMFMDWSIRCCWNIPPRLKVRINNNHAN